MVARILAKALPVVFLLLGSAAAQTGCARPYTYPSITDWIGCPNIMSLQGSDGQAYWIDFNHYACYPEGVCNTSASLYNASTGQTVALNITGISYAQLPNTACTATITGFKVVACWNVDVGVTGLVNGTLAFNFAGEHNPNHYPQVIYALAESPSFTSQ